MVSHNSKLCQNGINTLWALSLLPHLVFVALLNSLEKSKRGRRQNFGMENPSTFNDDNVQHNGMEMR